MLAFTKVMLYSEAMNKAFQRACDIVGAANLARHLGVTPQAINEWKKGKRPVPVSHGASIEEATKGVITRKEMFPDDWEKIWPELSHTRASIGRRSTDKPKESTEQ